MKKTGLNNYLSNGIRRARRLVITVAGFTVLAIGLVMIILPGPAILVIPVGLGILATEFMWARRLLKKAKSSFSKINKGGDSNEAK